jgi:hemolysin activation/secretion protein
MAQAQVIRGGDGAQEGLRRQEEREREQQRQLNSQPDVLAPRVRDEISTDLPQETPCFVIERVEFEPDVNRFGWLERAAGFVRGQCVGVQGLRQVVSVLDRQLIGAGYVTTRLSLPEQDLSHGTLRLRLHVGQVSAVRMTRAGSTENAPDDAWGTWWNAFPLSSGDVLNVRDLEQGVEQMKRLPSQDVNTRIEPGEAPDTSIVYIERQTGTWRDRVRGGLTVDNSGGQVLGRTQVSAYLAVDNPLGLNDVLNLSANTNGERPRTDHRSQSAGASYSIPFGYHSFSLSKNYSRYAQRVQGTTVTFLSSGKSDTTEGRWQYVAYRNASSKLMVHAALSTRQASSYLDDVELVVQRRKTTNGELGASFKYLFSRASLDVDVAFRRGLPWLHARHDLPGSGEDGPTLRPRIWSYGASVAVPFAVFDYPLQYSLAVRGQLTRDMTTSTDQISIGGRYSVRGFDGDNVLMAESGYTVRNELALPMRMAEGLDTVLYAGLDWGRVWGPSGVYVIGNQLLGTALGVRGRYARWQFDCAVGAPLKRPDGFQTRPWAPYLSLTYAF